MPFVRRRIRVNRAGYPVSQVRSQMRRKKYVKRAYVRRGIYNPQPTFTETFALESDNFAIQAGSGHGSVFKVAFNNIPQWQQYMNLYTQYKINWVKVIVLPSYDSKSADLNSSTLAVGQAGMARIAYSIQDSPNEVAPASEDEVLTDNGCKIRSFGSKWSCSFRPVPDIAVSTSTGIIPTKIRKSQWFSFDDTTLANNPKHGAVTAYVTVPGTPGTEHKTYQYSVYYKVNFSLRDPK